MWPPHCWISDPLLLNSLALKSPLQPTYSMRVQWRHRPRTWKV